jgi:AraC-like DNA-binding protein
LKSIGHHRHEDESGAFEQARCVPSPELAGIALSYTGYVHRGVASTRRREPAQDKVTLIINLGPRLLVGGPGFEITPADSFVAPLSDGYAVTEEGPALEGVQVDLTPIGARMVFGMPMSELSELIVDLEAVFGADLARLAEALHAARTWTGRFALLEEFLVERASAAPAPSPEVAWAWGRIQDSGGGVPAGRLAAEIGCSPRHLNARFRDQIGLGPKTVARIARFRRAAGLLSRDDGRRFAEIAQACGYYDQAHLNRDFRRLSGTTPGDYLAKSLPDGFGVAA